MRGRFLARRAGPIGLAITAFDIWRRLPPRVRKRVLKQARKHGPRVAKELWRRRPSRPPVRRP